MEKILQYLLFFVGLVIAIVALQPREWIEKLQSWSKIVPSSTQMLWTPLFFICMTASFILVLRRLKKNLTVWPTRKKWWDKILPRVISESESLIIIDSYQGSKHELWDSLEKRIHKPDSFHLIVLVLAQDDPMLQHCCDTSRVPNRVSDIDRTAIANLIKIRDASVNGGNKIIEFGYWSGLSQGPLVAWTNKQKNKVIAAGLWQQVAGNTDLSPWLVTKKGPLFTSLKNHCDSLVQGARKRGM